MLSAQDKIRFFLQYGGLVVMFAVFFAGVNAQTEGGINDSPYFLDVDRLEVLVDSNGSVSYIEKENNNNKWIFIPIKSSMNGYRKAVAQVVGAEFHRRFDRRLLVPDTKFLIRNGEHNGRYELLGSVYKKLSSTKSLQKIMEERDFDNCGDPIYRNHNVEHTIAVWKYLGLPISPSIANLELLEDDSIVRYDYYKSFQYDSEAREKCFCTYSFKISDYSCDLDIIKKSVQALQSKDNKVRLEEVISEIKADSTRYLTQAEFYSVENALEYISSKF